MTGFSVVKVKSTKMFVFNGTTLLLMYDVYLSALDKSHLAEEIVPFFKSLPKVTVLVSYL